MRMTCCLLLGSVALALGPARHACGQTVCAKGSELVLLAGGGPAGGPSHQATPDAGVEDPQGLCEACLDTSSGHLTSLGLKAHVNHASWIVVDAKTSTVYTTGTKGATGRDAGSLFAFHIDPATGALEPRGAALSGGSDATHIVRDANSGTLFVANHGEGVVGVIQTAPDGSIVGLTGKAQQEGSGPSPRQKNAEAHGVAIDPTGHFVLCSDFGADKLYLYRFDKANGTLTASSPAFVGTPAGSGPRHVLFSPDGGYVLMNTELDGQLRIYRWDGANGTLTQAGVVDPFPAGFKGLKSAGEITFSKDGRFFYLSLRGEKDTLITYSWSKSEGKLTEIDRLSVRGTPWSFGLDPTGRWMLVTNSGEGSVSVLAVDLKTGKLTPKEDALKLSSALTVAFLPR